MAGTVTAVNGAVGTTVSGGRRPRRPHRRPPVSGSGSATSPAASAARRRARAPRLLRGSSFITLAQLSRYKMQVSLSESDIGSVKVGQPATVTVNAASGEEFAARVTESASSRRPRARAPAARSATRSRYPRPDAQGLKAGMSATADIVTSQVTGLAVPSQALKGSTVTVQAADGTQTTQRVQTGVVGDSTTQVVSGLKAGDTLVVRSAAAALGAAAGGSNQLNNAIRSRLGAAASRVGSAAALGAAASEAGAAQASAAPAGAAGARRERAPRRAARPPPGHRDRGRRARLPAGRGRRGARAGRRLAAHRPRRVRGHHGQLGERQEHAHAHPRLPRRPDRRALPARRRRRPRHPRGRPRRSAQPQDRLRLSELQPGGAHDRAGQRRAAPGLRRPRAPRAPRRARRRARRGGHGRPPAPSPLRALRRPAAARRGRAGDRHRPRHRARRRADRQPRLALDRGDPRDLLAPECRGAHGHPDHTRGRRRGARAARRAPERRAGALG